MHFFAVPSWGYWALATCNSMRPTIRNNTNDNRVFIASKGNFVQIASTIRPFSAERSLPGVVFETCCWWSCAPSPDETVGVSKQLSLIKYVIIPSTHIRRNYLTNAATPHFASRTLPLQCQPLGACCLCWDFSAHFRHHASALGFHQHAGRPQLLNYRSNSLQP